MTRRKPTRKDLIALLTWAAHHAGSARTIYQNDRDPMLAEHLQERLTMMEDRLHEAAGFFPPPDPSPWTDDKV